MLTLVTFGIILSVSVICDCSCLSGTRRVRLPDGSEDCVFCKECPADQVVAKACSDKEDTICCPGNTFLSVTNKMCTNCSVCPAGQYVRSQCTVTEDSVCSECSDGSYNNASNSPICKSCAYCEHGVLVNCSRTSDTKCAVDRPKDEQTSRTTFIIICVVVVIVIISLVVAICIYLKCCRKRNKHRYKVKQDEAGVPLTDFGLANKDEEVKNEISADPTLAIDSTFEKQEPIKNEEKIESEYVTVDKDDIKDRQDKHVNDKTKTPEAAAGGKLTIANLYKNPSIGFLDDTVAQKSWPVFRVGERYVMTSFEAYECMEAARNGNLGPEIQKAYIFFTSTKNVFTILMRDFYVNKTLGVFIVDLKEKLDLPSPLVLHTTRLQQGSKLQIHLPLKNLITNIVDATCEKFNEDKVTTIKKYIQKHKASLLEISNEHNKVNSINGERVPFKEDILEKNIRNYKNSFCLTGTVDEIRPGSPVSLIRPGQEPQFVGVCTRTLPWFFQHMGENDKGVWKDGVFHLFTSFRDIQSKLNRKLRKELFN